jgi:hypothetical protein
MNLCPCNHSTSIFLAWAGATETDARLLAFTWRWKPTSRGARNPPGLRPPRTWAATWPGPCSPDVRAMPCARRLL